MRFDAVISDIDGCLGPESHAPMDAEHLAKLAAWNLAAAKEGDRPPMTLCSGRPQPYVEAMCRIMANTTLPVIAEMGVWLYDPRDNTFHRDPSITEADLDLVHDVTRWVERDLGPRGVVIQPGKTASLSLWHPDTAMLKGLMPTIAQTLRARNWRMDVSATVAWINLTLPHVSKSTGIGRLMKMCGLVKERLAGIGDTRGDAAIRQNVAFFACPANAEPELKALADYVSPHRESDGVLDILERLR